MFILKDMINVNMKLLQKFHGSNHWSKCFIGGKSVGSRPCGQWDRGQEGDSMKK